MKFHNITKFLEEAVAAKPLSLDTVTIPGNLQIIRFVDYVTTGIDEDFGHEGNNAGQSVKARSRANKRGNLSTHIDTCASCVNSILTKGSNESHGGMNVFEGTTYESTLVPRIPLEFMGDTENVDSEWDFMESCPTVMNNMKGEIKLRADTNLSGLLVNKNQIGPSSKIYRASLLYGYLNDENAIAVVDGAGSTVNVDIKKGYINLDTDMKYMDEDIEKRRPDAIALLKEIYSADPESFPEDSQNGTAKADIRALLSTFKSKVPENGEVFLSADEIKELIPVLEYFKVPKDQRETNDNFFDKVAEGMSALEKSGVHFGDYTTRTSEIQKLLTLGNYDLFIGYNQEGDKTHTETFKNRGEEIFVGYVTNYRKQPNGEVIPVYFVSQNPSQISSLKEKIGKISHIGKVSPDADVAYRKVNTDKTAKRTGGNELIFQLPFEIYSAVFNTPEVEEPAQTVNPEETPAATETPVTTPAPKKTAPKKAKEQKTPAEVAPEVAPKVAPITAKKENIPAKTNEPDSVKIGRILMNFGKQYEKGEISRAQAIVKIKETIKAETGKAIKSDSIANKLDSSFSKVSEDSRTKKDSTERTPDEIRREEQYNDLFSPEFRNTRLAKSAMPRINELAKLGHKYTPEELDNLASRGIDRKELEKAFGSAPVMEARISPTSYKINALLENINRTKLK